MVMGALEKQEQLDMADLPECFDGRVSVNAVKIMEQLGFITINNGIICKGVIRRCQLEDSPLYPPCSISVRTFLTFIKKICTRANMSFCVDKVTAAFNEQHNRY
ncbi:hypothetical protein EVA_09081 [gut metagenome]|uniref:Uncharacterized protein n=1 Tax=gut metagenome TaxID=749906 RepID=J9GRM6_9ZZZZ